MLLEKLQSYKKKGFLSDKEMNMLILIMKKQDECKIS